MINKANEDKSIGAIVMTGEGKGFCAGADIEETFQTRIDGNDPGNDTQSGSGGMPKNVDWSKLSEYERSDMTVGSQELACTAGVCELVDI